MRTSLRPSAGSRMLRGNTGRVEERRRINLPTHKRTHTHTLTRAHTHTQHTSDIIDHFIVSTAEFRPTMHSSDAQT